MIAMITPSLRRGIPGVIPDAWIINPGHGAVQPPVVVVHGIKREVEQMAQLMCRRAHEVQRTVILPHFDAVHWKKYQRAACPKRADIALLNLMRSLKDEGRVSPGRFDLAGFSGGAQFSHRFAWMYPNLVGRLCLTAPGWWTFPDPGVAWPYGMGAAARRGVEGLWLQANLRHFLDREIVVTVGSEDTARDANLRKGAEIDTQQGSTRVERARNWVRAMRIAAHDAGLRPSISFDLLQDCGHSFSQSVAQARLDRHFVVSARPCEGTGNCSECAGSRNINSFERTAA